MCCALEPAGFSHTSIYAAEVMRAGRLVHVLAYANTATNLAPQPGFWARLIGARPVGNAMLLHFPAKVPMTELNIIDASKSPTLFEPLRSAVFDRPDLEVAAEEDAPSHTAETAAVSVFDVGEYTVVLAENAQSIVPALRRVPLERRPRPQPAIFEWYARQFPGWPVALCCFSAKWVSPPPLVWWYEPSDPSVLFAPGLDAHDGQPPRLDGSVVATQTVYFGSYRATGGHEVRYDEAAWAPEIRALLTDRVIGHAFSARLPNGDFVTSVDDVRRGVLDVQRRSGAGFTP